MSVPTTAAQLAPIIVALKKWRQAAALPTLGSFAVALAVIDKTAAARKELLNILDRVMGEPCAVEQGTPTIIAEVLNDAWTLASANKLPREVAAGLVPTLDGMIETLDKCAEPNEAKHVVGKGDETKNKIVECCRSKPRKGETIANKLGYSTDYVRALCSELVKAGRLRNVAGGYLAGDA